MDKNGVKPVMSSVIPKIVGVLLSSSRSPGNRKNWGASRLFGIKEIRDAPSKYTQDTCKQPFDTNGRKLYTREKGDSRYGDLLYLE